MAFQRARYAPAPPPPAPERTNAAAGAYAFACKEVAAEFVLPVARAPLSFPLTAPSPPYPIFPLFSAVLLSFPFLCAWRLILPPPAHAPRPSVPGGPVDAFPAGAGVGGRT